MHPHLSSYFQVVYLFLFGCLVSILFIFQTKKRKIRKKKKYKNSVFVYVGTCVPWMAIETKFLNFVYLVA